LGDLLRRRKYLEDEKSSLSGGKEDIKEKKAREVAAPVPKGAEKGQEER